MSQANGHDDRTLPPSSAEEASGAFEPLETTRIPPPPHQPGAPDAHTLELVEAALARLDLEARVRLLTGSGFWRTAAEPAIELREMVLCDGPAGVRGERFDEREPSASLPCPTALAASWDESLVERLGALLAIEARRKQVDVVLGPTVNLQRSPYAGRHFECYSEEPLLSGRVGAALVRGIQAGGVAATVKHYTANDSETERYSVDVRMSERALHEVHLAPFEEIVRAGGVWALMAAYNSVDGVTMTESPLLETPLRTEWGFDGLVVSDWFATRSTEGAGRAELDLAMPGPGPDQPWGAALVAAVRAGLVPAEAIERKVRRLLLLAARVGALGALVPPAPPRPAPDAAALLREAAAAGMVLLHDTGTALPLTPDTLRRVAVLGPNAEVARIQGGGSATVIPPYAISPLAGLRAALGPDVEVTHAVGARIRHRLPAVTGADVHDPKTGEPGLRVRFIGPDGELLHEELRGGGRLLWLDDPIVARAVAIEAVGVLRARIDGPHRIGVAGVGRFRLLADGVPLVDDDLVTEDPLGGILTPPERWAVLDLAADREVELHLRHDFAAERPGTGFVLGVDRPVAHEDAELDHAVALAAQAEVAVVVVGSTEESDSEGRDRSHLSLPGRQDELIRRVAAVNSNTVVVVNSGSPVLLPWRADVAAILVSWFPGQEFGAALADVLLGHREPGGRLPMTWPAHEDDPAVLSTTPVAGRLDYAEGIHIGYRGWLRAGVTPAYPFGHGLGWTTWEHLWVETVASGADFVARVRIRNTGPRPGRHLVQAYLSRADGMVERPVLWLAGHTWASAPAGAEVTVELTIPARAFGHWSAESGRRETEPGGYTLRIGGSSAELPLTAKLEVGPGLRP
ncbi:glycoside hydrolase family 3 C-terminal domain-containing protein [Embleya sp. NPDC005971]|uniref:beta-glucosidase family protein n=1 Tax=Embleya sp. NPDC005971 TaxID=3156724 RepID=UPI0033FDD728